MSIHDWPPSERPREKLLHQGASSLSDAELIAIFLRTGIRGCNAVDLARQLLIRFPSLHQLLAAPLSILCATPGIGINKYIQLQAALELGRRYLQSQLQNPYPYPFNRAELVSHYLIAELRHHTEEVFACLFLNNQHYFLAFEKLFFGTVHRSIVYPRKIIQRALYHNAAAVIFAHNHPSGIVQPSAADLEVTEELIKILAILDIRVLDHLIIGEQNTFSFAAQQLL